MHSNTPTLPVTLAIRDMMCGHCVNHVRRILEDLPGVRVESVAIGSATVTLDPARTTPDAAAAAVDKAGYPTQLRASTPKTSPTAIPT